MLLANHGALTVGADLFGAYYKMETIEHFAKISLVARMLGRENLLSREEVMRLQGLRGTYGIKAPAPICADRRRTWPQAGATGGVPGRAGAKGGGPAPRATSARGSLRRQAADDEGEIRLTYRELSALIEEAIRSLRGGG